MSLKKMLGDLQLLAIQTLDSQRRVSPDHRHLTSRLEIRSEVRVLLKHDQRCGSGGNRGALQCVGVE